jgi:hypothetical protein
MKRRHERSEFFLRFELRRADGIGSGFQRGEVSGDCALARRCTNALAVKRK